ncbi:short-chain dehydrogenase [Moniliophthora roreri]|uniref:Short-chain dehydrogenase n=1 Tax=Moniliophthora roreri TaxID=221103 RepID=A0A0W0FWJ1_MONRR|nr:short-chain dehydrogenase [Moniliophthora roreri]
MAFQIKLEEQQASNLFDLRGVVAVVSGGGSGIGLMISSTLIANGAKVYIIGPKQEDLDRIARLYNAEAEKIPGGGSLIGLEGDISIKSEAKRLADEIGSREPYITVLFNNAGIGGKFTPPPIPTVSAYVSTFFDSFEQEDFNNILNTNAVGHYWMTFAFLPLLEKWKNSEEPATKKFVPQVIMTSSMNGWTKASARSYPYMFSKSAIGHATATLAHELLPLGIRVNGIAPGLFPTEMIVPGSANEAGFVTIPTDVKLELQVPAIPSGGTRRDMGTVALCLVANWYINGETVLVDGGSFLKHPSSY